MLRDINFNPAVSFLLSGFLIILRCLCAGCSGLIFIAFAPFFFCLDSCISGHRIAAGVTAGLVLSFCLIYWLSQITFTGTLFFCLWNASGFILISFLWKRIRAGLTVSFLYAFCEWGRDFIIPGSSFGSLGLILSDNPLFIQMADIGGVPLVGFWIMGVNYSLFRFLQTGGKALRFRSGMLVVLWIVIPLLYGVLRLEESSLQKPQILRVGMIQPNILPTDKWNINREKEIFSALERLSMELIFFKPDVLLWPETSIPVSWHFNQEAQALTKRTGEKLQCSILFGSIDSRMENHYNSVFYSDPNQGIVSIYHKVNLVPFGEYIPLVELFPFLENIVPLPFPFKKGDEEVTFTIKGVNILPLICFEDSLSRFVRKAVQLEKPGLLAVFTNDGWFKGPTGPLNHDRLARFRALENGIPMIRCTNTGVSSVIDASGRVLDRITIKGRVEGVEGAKGFDLRIMPVRKTFFSAAGDLWLALCFICSICVEMGMRRKV